MKEKETGDTMNKKDSTAILDLKQYEDFFKIRCSKDKERNRAYFIATH